MTRLSDLHEKWLKDPDYVREYRALEGEFTLAESLIQARLKAGLTQSDLAARMHTTQSVIARLEGGSSFPSTRTLKRIAEATGTRLRISFEASDVATRDGRRGGPAA